MSERAKEIRRRRKRKEKSQKARKKEAISAATRKPVKK